MTTNAIIIPMDAHAFENYCFLASSWVFNSGSSPSKEDSEKLIKCNHNQMNQTWQNIKGQGFFGAMGFFSCCNVTNINWLISNLGGMKFVDDFFLKPISLLFKFAHVIYVSSFLQEGIMGFVTIQIH